MLPPSHIAYTWLTLSLAQEYLKVAPDADYRLVALAAVGPDLIDKPLAWAYFYKRYKAAVLFAHPFLANFGVFVEIEQRIDGLVHISDMARHGAAAADAMKSVAVGDVIDTVVLSIDLERRRIALGLPPMESAAAA